MIYKRPIGLNGHLGMRECTLLSNQQRHHRINKNQKWQTIAALQPVNTIEINRHTIKTVYLCLSEPSPKVEKKFLKE